MRTLAADTKERAASVPDIYAFGIYDVPLVLPDFYLPQGGGSYIIRGGSIWYPSASGICYRSPNPIEQAVKRPTQSIQPVKSNTFVCPEYHRRGWCCCSHRHIILCHVFFHGGLLETEGDVIRGCPKDNQCLLAADANPDRFLSLLYHPGICLPIAGERNSRGLDDRYTTFTSTRC